MNNHPMTIEYDPESMWFDYQALFDQTKIWVLYNEPIFQIKKYETIPVQHTDFEKNTLAKKVFGDKVNNTQINDACNGFYPAISSILAGSTEYLAKHGSECSQDDYLLLIYNFKFLLAICVQFSYDDSEYRKEYLRFAGENPKNIPVPDNIGIEYISSIDDTQLYKVIMPIF